MDQQEDLEGKELAYVSQENQEDTREENKPTPSQLQQMETNESCIESREASETKKQNLTEDDITERCIKWGLGRGVDITKETPWLEKSSFQVRAVCIQDLVETDEGGLLKGYSDLVNSTTTIRSQVQAGVKAPDVPISIGVDLEYSRTDCSSKHVVGLKVKNRTLSFRLDFKDLQKSWVTDLEEAKKEIKSLKREYTKKKNVNSKPAAEDETDRPGTTSESIADDPSQKTTDTYLDPSSKADGPSLITDTKPEDDPFEQRLWKWLMECREHHRVHFTSLSKKKSQSINSQLRANVTKGDDRTFQLIDSDDLQRDICSFVRHLGVTHYVSAIELGGSQFSILTEKEYRKKILASGRSSLNAQLYGGIEASSKQSRFRKSKSRHTERKMIGKITMEDGREVVKKENEAVIGCQIRPISNLVGNPFLRLAVIKAIKEYTETKISNTGPYLISCGDMYLAVNTSNNEITITHSKTGAFTFFLRTVNDAHRHHDFEFSLASTLNEEPVNGMVPLEYTMQMRVNPVTGRGNCPPQMRCRADYRRTRLLLKNRNDPRIPVSTKEWIKGTDAFYIQCINPIVNGFLCVKEKRRSQHNGRAITEKEFKVFITGSNSTKKDENQYYMLFRLQPIDSTPRKPEHPTKSGPKEDKVEQEANRLEMASITHEL